MAKTAPQKRKTPKLVLPLWNPFRVQEPRIRRRRQARPKKRGVSHALEKALTLAMDGGNDHSIVAFKLINHPAAEECTLADMWRGLSLEERSHDYEPRQPYEPAAQSSGDQAEESGLADAFQQMELDASLPCRETSWGEQRRDDGARHHQLFQHPLLAGNQGSEDWMSLLDWYDDIE